MVAPYFSPVRVCSLRFLAGIRRIRHRVLTLCHHNVKLLLALVARRSHLAHFDFVVGTRFTIDHTVCISRNQSAMAASTKRCIDLSDEVVDLAYQERIAEQKILKLKLKQARQKMMLKMLLVYHKDRAFDGVGLGPTINEVSERRRKKFENQALNLVMARRLAQVRKVRRNMQAKRDGGM